MMLRAIHLGGLGSALGASTCARDGELGKRRKSSQPASFSAVSVAIRRSAALLHDQTQTELTETARRRTL